MCIGAHYCLLEGKDVVFVSVCSPGCCFHHAFGDEGTFLIMSLPILRELVYDFRKLCFVQVSKSSGRLSVVAYVVLEGVSAASCLRLEERASPPPARIPEDGHEPLFVGCCFCNLL